MRRRPNLSDLEADVRRFAGVTLYHGDCRDILPLLDVEAVVTDPPYGVNYRPSRSISKNKKWNKQPQFSRVLHDDEVFDPGPLLKLDVPMVVWGANHYAASLPNSGGWLVWDKKRGGTISRGFSGSDAELAWTNLGGMVRTFSYLWAGLCREAEIGEHYHPTQKPVNLMYWCVSLVPVGKAICDPYMGSGSTGIACIRSGRKFVGIEKDRAHFETACERIEQELSQGLLWPHQTLAACAGGTSS